MYSIYTTISTMSTTFFRQDRFFAAELNRTVFLEGKCSTIELSYFLLKRSYEFLEVFT